MQMIEMDDLQAGRELDALVAGKVMGWKSVAMAGLLTQFPATALCGLPPGAQFNDELQIVPRYSTHIAAAWEIVEHLRSKGFLVKLYDDATALMFHVSFSRPDKEISFRDFGEAGQEAFIVCRAALKAVE